MSSKPPVLSIDPNNPYAYPATDIESGKLWAVLSYLVFPLFVVPIIQKDNHFALFHAKQAIVLMIGGFAAGVMAIVMSIATAIVGLGVLGRLVGFALFLAILAFVVMGVIAAVQGRYKPLPAIGPMAEQWFKGLKVEKKTV